MDICRTTILNVCDRIRGPDVYSTDLQNPVFALMFAKLFLDVPEHFIKDECPQPASELASGEDGAEEKAWI